MRCKDFQELLLEYRDGELDQELAASMQLHLGNCQDCAAQLKELETEGALLKRFKEAVELDLEVDSRMWSKVRARIAPSDAGMAADRGSDMASLSNRSREKEVRVRGFLRQAGIAAALVVVSVAATLFAVKYSDSLKTKSPAVSSDLISNAASDRTNRVPNEEKSLEGAMRAIRKAEQDYIDAIYLLSDIVDKRKPSLDPVLARELERNLRMIDENIEATRKAYYAHPSDPYLAQYMLTSYSRKVELLQEIAS